MMIAALDRVGMEAQPVHPNHPVWGFKWGFKFASLIRQTVICHGSNYVKYVCQPVAHAVLLLP